MFFIHASLSLAQAQRPAALGVLARPAQKLNQESRQCFDGASKARRGEQGTQYRILRDTRIERHRQFVAGLDSAQSFKEI